MIFSKRKKPPHRVEDSSGQMVAPIEPVEIRKRIAQAIEGQLKPLGFLRNRSGWFIKQRDPSFEDELRISFDNSHGSLGVGVSPFCGVSFPALQKRIGHLLDKKLLTQIGIAQNLGYVSPQQSFATYWFPLDREPEPLACQIASDFLRYGVPFCESIRTYDDALSFMEENNIIGAFFQFKKSGLHLMAGRKSIAVELAREVVRDLERQSITDKFYAVPALENARRALEWIEQA